MNKYILVLIVIFAGLLNLYAEEVRFGERPYIDIYEVPDSAIEQGMIKIKLHEDYTAHLDRLQHEEGRIMGFGIRELDEICQYYGAREIVQLFYSPALKNKFTLRHRQWGFHLWYEIRVGVQTDLRQMITDFRNLKGIIDWAEPEYRKTLVVDPDSAILFDPTEYPRWSSNDPRLGEQWHYNNTGQQSGTPGCDIKLFNAWDIEKGHSDVIVAVIDGGIQFNHVDLALNIWSGIGYNFVTNSPTIEPHNHGTHVAGTIAGVTNNNIGVAGVAGGNGVQPGVSLMSCQVFTASSSGGFHLAPIYAADNDAAVSQNSWSYTSAGYYDQNVLDAIDYFNANGGGTIMSGGITIFAASNNNSESQWYPACYSGSFAVAATTNQDRKAYYSSFGTWVDVSAPGGETNTVSARGVLSTLTGNSYGFYQGTSMACPHVSGIAALALSLIHRNNSTISNTQLANALRNGTDNHYAVNPSYIGKLGTGRVNTYTILSGFIAGIPSCTITAPANNTQYNIGDIVQTNVNATDSDGTITRVDFFLNDSPTPSFTDTTAPYQWNWNTTGYSGATYTIKATAFDNSNNQASDQISIMLLSPADEGFESGDFSAFPWAQSGNLPWTVQSSQVYSGTYAAKSGAINHNQQSILSVQMTVSSAGSISFFKRVSCEAHSTHQYDYLAFYIDGVEQERWSGDGQWQMHSYAVNPGLRTFRWTYSKDGSVVSFSDCAWLDHITFPPFGTYYDPPQNLAAYPSHQSVILEWQAPVSGTPTGYKIYKNGALLTTVAGLTYTDLAVTNGTQYSYYIKALYGTGESDATATVVVTPNAQAPTNLVAISGNGFVNLSWTAATGRGVIDTEPAVDRSISGYRIYRNGSPIATQSGVTYSDTNVVNNITYTYYVTTVYTNPAGESGASNSVQATPSDQIPLHVILGSGTGVTSVSTAAPINIWYRSLHGQSVYTKAELNAAGVFGPMNITHVGFYNVSAPIRALPNFIIRMKHTSANDVESWQTLNGMTTVYTNGSYMPTIGDFELLALNTPFVWNGIDNIVIDTAFGLVTDYSQSGTVRYTTVTNGYRYVRNDNSDQTLIFSGGYSLSSRPNVKLTYQLINNGPAIAVDPASISFGEIAVNTASVKQFTIFNSGNQTLTGTITTPDGFTVSESTRALDPSISRDTMQFSGRNSLGFSINASQSKVFDLTFHPSTSGIFDGNMVISSNATNDPVLNVSVSGSAYIPPSMSVSTDLLEATLAPDQQTMQNFSISNTGERPLTYSIQIQESRSDRVINQKPASLISGRSIAGSTLTLDAENFTPGTTVDWTFSVFNASNDNQWLQEVVIDFPDGITVNSATSFVGGSLGNMNPDVTSGNGITITWFGQSGEWGVVYPNETAVATVNLTISANQFSMIELPFQITGDDWGAQPHSISGTIQIEPSIVPIAWFSALPLTGSIAAGQSQIIESTFSSQDLPIGEYLATMTISSNDPFNPAHQVTITLTVTDPAPPSVPMNVTIVIDDISGNAVISWDASSGNPDGYEIFRSDYPVSDVGSASLLGFVPAPLTQFIDDQVPLRNVSFYFIRAVRMP